MRNSLVAVDVHALKHRLDRHVERVRVLDPRPLPNQSLHRLTNRGSQQVSSRKSLPLNNDLLLGLVECLCGFPFNRINLIEGIQET